MTPGMRRELLRFCKRLPRQPEPAQQRPFVNAFEPHEIAGAPAAGFHLSRSMRVQASALNTTKARAKYVAPAVVKDPTCWSELGSVPPATVCHSMRTPKLAPNKR